MEVSNPKVLLRSAQKVRRKKKPFPPTAETKILKHDFTQETVQKEYGLSFQIKCDIKIIMFQYKILATKMSLLEPKLLTTMFVLNV